MDPQEAQKQAMHMFALMIPFMIVGWAVALAIIIIPFWQIFKKAGMSAGVIASGSWPIVPFVNLFIAVCASWPSRNGALFQLRKSLRRWPPAVSATAAPDELSSAASHEFDATAGLAFTVKAIGVDRQQAVEPDGC